MKCFLLSTVVLMMLSGCSETGVSNVEEQPIDVLSAETEKEPEHGDIFIIETENEETTVFAYVETGTEFKVDEEDDLLNIHFEEPGESEDLMLYSLDLEVDLDRYTVNFYINGESVEAENV